MLAGVHRRCPIAHRPETRFGNSFRLVHAAWITIDSRLRGTNGCMRAPTVSRKTANVKVSFTDDADSDKGPLASEPYPATETVAGVAAVTVTPTE